MTVQYQYGDRVLVRIGRTTNLNHKPEIALIDDPTLQQRELTVLYFEPLSMGVADRVIVEVDTDMKGWSIDENEFELHLITKFSGKPMDEIKQIHKGRSGWWVPARYVEKVATIAAAHVRVDQKEDGCKCKCCHEFKYMASPNQPDGTLICFSCRQDPYRSSTINLYD